MSCSLEVELSQPVAVIRLIGDRFHTIDWDFPDAMQAALAGVRNSPGVRALILTGGPRLFSAGADLAVLAELTDTDTIHRWLTAQHQTILALTQLPLPVIALVDGAAAGAGMNLALAADHLIATPRARFSQAFIGIGLATDMGSLHLLPRRVGVQRARELMWTGRTVDATEAMAIGLVDRLLTADEDPFVEASNEAATWSAMPLMAFNAIKQGIERSSTLHFAESLDLELELQLPVASSADFSEGVSAFRSKRSPRYTDRPHPTTDGQ